MGHNLKRLPFQSESSSSLRCHPSCSNLSFLSSRLVSKPSPKAVAPTAPSRIINASKTGSNVNNQAIEELSNQLMDMRLNLEGLEKERDFYFSKLRDIEILCQEADEAETSPIITKILDILYATEVSCPRQKHFHRDLPLIMSVNFRMALLHQMNWHRKKKSIKLISDEEYHFCLPSLNNKLNKKKTRKHLN